MHRACMFMVLDFGPRAYWPRGLCDLADQLERIRTVHPNPRINGL